MEENIKEVSLNIGMVPVKMKGHTTITLTDVNTGEVEVHEDDNYMTNAIANYFANCGFMNYPNLDKNNMVELMLGGVMAFDEPISENTDDPTIVHVPAGHKMIANGAVGYTNNTEVLEAGSYSTTESGWQNDGSYVQTYDYTTTQANGTISCVCLAGRNYAWAGEGNSISNVRHATKSNITDLAGSVTSFSGISGYIFNIDLTDSSCCAFSIETRTDEQTEQEYKIGVLRKYRLPISKINIKGTLSAPILLSEQDVQLDSDLATLAGSSSNTFMHYAHDGKLLLWNMTYNAVNQSVYWGNGFTQYLWTLTSAGVLTKETVTNTTGADIHGLSVAHFDGDYCIFADSYCVDASGSAQGYVRLIVTSTIYIWDRANNTMTAVQNNLGTTYNCGYNSGRAVWSDHWGASAGFARHHGSGDGRIMFIGSSNDGFIVDADLERVYPHNAATSLSSYVSRMPTSSPLISADGLNLYRDQGYIASINNLETPVVKTAEKTMKIVYRITFEEGEE